MKLGRLYLAAQELANARAQHLAPVSAGPAERRAARPLELQLPALPAPARHTPHVPAPSKTRSAALSLSNLPYAKGCKCAGIRRLAGERDF